MSITSQLPPIPLAQASAPLRALAQAAGQTVEARVLGQSGNGTTHVQIGRQVLSLALPEGQPVGTTLTLSVQQADGQLRLALVAARPPTAAVVTPPQGSAIPAPATSVQLSAAALSSPSVTQPTVSAPTAPATATAPATNVAQPAPPSGAPAASVGASSPVSPAPPYSGLVGAPATVNAAPTPTVQVAIGVPATPVAAPQAPPAAGPAVLVRPAAAVSGQAVPPATGTQPVVPSATSLPPPAAGTAPPPPTVSTAATAPAAAATPGVVPSRADIPYAVAAPAAVAPQLASVVRSTVTVTPPVAPTVSSSTTGQHAPSSNMPGVPTTSAAPGTSAAPVAPAPPAASPQAALAQMVQQSLPRQDSIIGLTTALTAIAGKVALPEPVAKAAQQLLGARVPLDGVRLGGAVIKAAIQKSGVFQEALLASGQGQTAAGDTKSALLALRQSLGAWLGNQAPVSQLSAVAPPLRGHIPRARAGDGAPMDMPDDPMEVGKLLLDRTEAALSRLRLHQNASLPDTTAARQDAQWSMDLPVVVAGQQHLLQLQIHRDAEKDAERPEDRGWQVRFAINLAERGEVGAQISLRAKNTSVLLWADHAETAQSLAGAVDGLREAIGEVGLIAGAIVVRAGAPADQQPQPADRPGHYVDATR